MHPARSRGIAWSIVGGDRRWEDGDVAIELGTCIKTGFSTALRRIGRKLVVEEVANQGRKVRDLQCMRE